MQSDLEADVALNQSEPLLIRGGPFYQAQQATRLIRSNQWNVGRRVTAAIIIGWLPLILITAVLNFGGLASLLRDYRVNSRMLIAVPVLSSCFFRSPADDRASPGNFGIRYPRAAPQYGFPRKMDSFPRGPWRRIPHRPECSTLSDFGRVYEKLKELKPYPIDVEGISVVIPMLPVVLAAIPLVVVLKTLLEALR
jgi:hypothetical protein